MCHNLRKKLRMTIHSPSSFFSEIVFFQQNKAHGVDFSELLYFYQRNPGKISQTRTYIYIILARKHEMYVTCYILTFAVNVPSNLNKCHIYKNENLNQRFSKSASSFLKSDI